MDIGQAYETQGVVYNLPYVVSAHIVPRSTASLRQVFDVILVLPNNRTVTVREYSKLDIVLEVLEAAFEKGNTKDHVFIPISEISPNCEVCGQHFVQHIVS